MVTDPVCGMMLDPDDCHYFTEIDGESYCFCSHACMQKFDLNPAAYTNIDEISVVPDDPFIYSTHVPHQMGRMPL